MSANCRAVVLFGCSGFLGRNIIDSLYSTDMDVYGINSTGKHVDRCVKTFKLDEIDSLPRLPNNSVIINAAAFRYNAENFKEDQLLAFDTNVNITNKLFEFAVKRKINEVRFASSSAVYPSEWSLLDDDRVLPFAASPNMGEFHYAWSKRWGEISADYYHKNYGINTISFRLSNPYGPYDTKNEDIAHVATAFIIRAIKKDEVFIVRGNPDVRRDFVYAGDVAEIFKLSLGLSGVHDAFNLAFGKTYSIKMLAEMVLLAADKEKKIVYSNNIQSNNVANRRLKTDKIKKILKFDPFVSLEEGLKLTLKWYENDAV